jgi:hypothetical protein
MKGFYKEVLASVAIVILASVGLHFMPTAVSAQDATEEITQTLEEQTTQPDEPAVYHYIAQPGDCYSLIARKAAQTYGAIHSVELSLAQIMYIETNLTQQAGSPILDTGQEVAIQESDIQAWVEQANQLSSDILAAWDYYVQFANFNTDDIGEASSI